MGPGSTGLADLLDLRPAGDGVWAAATHGVRLPHVFGGQLVAQSLVAGGRAAPPRMRVHSVHTTFLRAGDPRQDLRLHVRPLRAGRLVCTVEVEARQGSRLLSHSIVSCTAQAGGISHARVASVLAGPDDSTDLAAAAAPSGGLGQYWDDFAAIEVRLAPSSGPAPVHSASAPRGVWMRVAHDLPPDPLIHQGAFAYASDLMVMSTAVTPHGHEPGDEQALGTTWQAVSLDHSIWFRRPVRADAWLLFEHTTPMAQDSRALVEVAVFDVHREVVAQVAQEALIRAREEVPAR